MGHHTFDPEDADRLEDAAARYRYLSMEELVVALEPEEDDVVADLGSGTGFYVDDVAPRVGKVYAVDVQEEMHALYRDKGVPPNVETVTADVADLPLVDDELDAAYTTMTYHEFASPEALEGAARVLRDGGRFFVADWSAEGDGEAGPPTDERYVASESSEALRGAGFVVERVEERTETFVIEARA